MKRNPDFMMSEVAGLRVLIPMGKMSEKLNGMITMNETGAFLWNRLENEATVDELVSALLSEYQTTEDQARKDVLTYLNTLKQKECIFGEIQ